MESAIPLLIIFAVLALGVFACFRKDKGIGNGQPYAIPRDADGNPIRPAPPNPMPHTGRDMVADILLASGRFDLVEDGDRITIVRKPVQGGPQ